MSQQHDLLMAVQDFDALSGPEQTEALLYIFMRTTGGSSGTGADLERLRADLGLAKGRCSQHLANHTKKRGVGSFAKRSRGYALTPERVKVWQERIEGRSQATETARALREHLASVPAGPLRDYLEETVQCFEARLLRATVVIAWCAGYYSLRDWLHTKELGRLNSQMAKWRKPISIVAVEDFESLSERVVIDTSREAGILSKSTHKILVALLDQRNSYAHPSGRSISESVAEAFVQQTIDEVIVKFSL